MDIAGATYNERVQLNNWRLIAPLLVVVAICTVLALPVFYFESQEMWDHAWHQDYAARWYATGTMNPPLPHIGYHTLLMSLKSILPQIDWRWLGMGTMIVVYALLAVMVYHYVLLAFERQPMRTRWLCVGITVLLLYIGPINIFTWSSENLYFGYISPNSYHNPTSILLKPIAFAQFVLALHLLTRKRTAAWMPIAAIILSVAGAFVKPNYALSMLPALALLTLWRILRRQPVAWSIILSGFGVINLIVLLGQYIYMTSTRGFIFFAPLDSIHYHEQSDLWIALKLPLSIAFPIVVALTNWREARRSLPLGFAWLAFFFSALQFYLLNESEHPGAGNFWWGAQICLFILMIASVRFWLTQLRWDTAQAKSRSLPSLSLAGIALFLHGVSGLVWWGIHVYQNFLGYPARAWW